MIQGSVSRQRWGAGAGLGLCLLTLAGLHGLYTAGRDAHGPTGLEPVAHEGASTLAFTPDGRRLRTADTGGVYYTWDLRTGAREFGTLTGRSLIISDDAREVELEGDVCLARGPSGFRCLLLKPGETAWSVPFAEDGGATPGGRWVFGMDALSPSLRVFDPATRRLERRRRVPGGSYRSGSSFFFLPGGRRRRRILSPEESLGSAALSGDRRRLAVTTGRRPPFGLAVVDLEDGSRRVIHRERWLEAPRLVFSHDGSRLAVTGQDVTGRQVLVVDTATGTERLQLSLGPPAPVRDAAARFSPSGDRISIPATADREYALGLVGLELRRETVGLPWVLRLDGATRTPELPEPRRIRGHQGPLRATAWAPDGSLLATLGLDGRVGLWTRDGAFLRFLRPE